MLPFTRDVASWSPERFVVDVLVEALHAQAVVVGANFRFGAKAAGDVAALTELGRAHDFQRRGHRARRRPAGLVLDVHPQLPALR